MTVDLKRLSTQALIALLATALLLVILDGLISYGGLIESRAIRRLFNITREDSIPNWFASIQFLLISLTLWVTYLRARGLDGGKWQARGWAFFAGIFLYLSIDDGSRLHERVGTWVTVSARGSQSLLGAAVQADPSYTWHVVFGPIFAAIGLFLLIFVWRALGSALLKTLFLAALGCFFVAQSMDFLEGIDAVVEHLTRILSVREHTVRHFSKSAEELLEDVGQTLLLVVFLRHLGNIAGDWRITFRMPEHSRAGIRSARG